MADTQIADVGLVLEGTYPYVLGGVSAWVDQIIRGLPDLSFALFYIGSRKDASQKQHYQFAPNVVSCTEVYLQDHLPPAELKPGNLPAALRANLYARLADFYLAQSLDDRANCFWKLIAVLDEADGHFTFGNLCQDHEVWEIVQQAYDSFAPEESFIDFFWTTRFLHLPLWAIWRARRQMPPARLYHSVSAGYAGWVASLAARSRGVALLLTEHGIYTKERIAEICHADWIYESDQSRISHSEGLGKLKQLWIGLFHLLGRLAYDTAAQIITLYEGNALTQIEFGADSRKIQIIPNGIDPEKLNPIRDQIQTRWQPAPAAKSVGFIGRVVPIKDVKTLMRAARLVCERCPEVQFLIAGPYAEDPEYFEECQKIVKLLQIEDKVHFLGPQKLTEILPRLDVMVLTSISEGLPLVVLEAMAAGIPVVATDVGACRELIFGRSPADKALGRSGRLTKILSPQETAQALVAILQNPEMWRSMGAAGRRRAEQHYSMSSMLDNYRQLYRTLAAQGQPPSVAHALEVACFGRASRS